MADVFTMDDFGDNDDLISLHGETEDQVSQQTTSKRSRKKPHYYTDSEDIAILMEVLAEKVPRKGAADKWKRIFERVSISVKDYKAIKTRFDVLYNAFKKDESAAFRGSGLEEDYNEKKRLMTEIVSQLDDWIVESTSSDDKKSKDDSQAKAKRIRDEALVGLKESEEKSPDDSGTPIRRRVKRSAGDFLEMVKTSEDSDREHKKLMLEMETKRMEIMERDMKLREDSEKHRRDMDRRQMEIEEKRIEMENRRIELERERSKREQEERALFLQLLQKNQ